MKEGGKTPHSTHLFCPLVPFTHLPFFLSFSCSLSSALPAQHYKNSMIMLQTWAAEQITFSKGESGDRTSREAGKDSHWVTKGERKGVRLQEEWKSIAAWKETIARGKKWHEERKRREDRSGEQLTGRERKKELQWFSWGSSKWKSREDWWGRFMMNNAIKDKGEEKETDDRKKGEGTDEGRRNQWLDQAEGGEARMELLWV